MSCLDFWGRIDAGTQRFISLDPIGFSSGDFNFYRYVGNNVVNFRDPSGLCVPSSAPAHEKIAFGVCDEKYYNISGEWGGKIDENLSKEQNPEGVQDQFNFGTGAYVADLEIWKMEENIDIGEQIHQSVNTEKTFLTDTFLRYKLGGVIDNRQGSMNKVYETACSQVGEPIDFKWKNRAFGGNPFTNLMTEAWPFGRTSADVTGEMTCDENGNYSVDGTMKFNNDKYSWKEDGTGWNADFAKDIRSLNTDCAVLGSIRDVVAAGFDYHNTGIDLLSRGENSPGDGNMYTRIPYTSGTQWSFFEDDSVGSVSWKEPSSDYNNSTDNGEMPVHYVKDYNFHTEGGGPKSKN